MADEVESAIRAKVWLVIREKRPWNSLSVKDFERGAKLFNKLLDSHNQTSDTELSSQTPVTELNEEEEILNEETDNRI